MYTRRGFLKTTAYAGIGFTVVSALEPLTAFAAVTRANPAGESPIVLFLNGVRRLIEGYPEEDLVKWGDMIKLANLYLQYGDTERAVKVVSDAAEAAETFKGFHADTDKASILNKAAKFFKSIGDDRASRFCTLEAFQVTPRIPETGIEEDCMISSAVNLAVIGEKEKALMMLDSAGRIIKPRSLCMTLELASAYEEMETIYGDYRMHDKAMDIVYAFSKNETIDERHKARWLAKIQERYLDMGKGQLAYNFMGTVMDCYNNLDKTKRYGVAEDISAVWARYGEWERAFEIAEEGSRENCYFRIAGHAIKTGEMDIARKAAYPALTNLKAADERYLFELSFPEVAALFVSLGDAGQAERIIHESLNYLEGSSLLKYFRIIELSGIAALYGRMGRNSDARKLLHKALESVDAKEDITYRAESMLTIAEAYISSRIVIGDKEMAVLKGIVRENNYCIPVGA